MFPDRGVRRPLLAATLLLAVVACGDDGGTDPDIEPPPSNGNVLAISAGGAHTCALRTDGVAFCWGENGSGQVGDGTDVDRAAPVAVQTALRFTAISAGDTHTCALTAAGQAWCWGDNVHGQVGGDAAADIRLAPTLVGAQTFAMISAGQDHSCGVATDGNAYCWGQAFLGDSELRTRRATPQLVQGGPYRTISAATNYTCAIRTSDAAVCWGTNATGLLGIGTDEAERPFPTAVAGGRSWIDLESGVSHTCGIASDEQTYCWGANTTGQLGTGTAGGTSNAPVAVTGGHELVEIVASELYSCGLTSTLTLCWGRGSVGQLGTGDVNQRNAPAQAAVIGAPLVSVSSFRGHTCGRTANGVAWCWGTNAFGQLGTGTANTRELRPVVVTLPAAS